MLIASESSYIWPADSTNIADSGMEEIRMTDGDLRNGKDRAGHVLGIR